MPALGRGQGRQMSNANQKGIFMTDKAISPEPILKAVQAEAEDLASQIRAKQEQVENRKAGYEKFKNDIREREQLIADVKDQAGQALAAGEDPQPFLDRLQSLQSEVAVIKDMVSGSDVRPGSQEERDIAKLQSRLAGTISRTISESHVYTEVQADFEDKLRELQDLVETWEKSLKTVFDSYGVPRKHLSLKVNDRSLATWCEVFFRASDRHFLNE